MSEPLRDTVIRMLESQPAVAMIAYDRYLDVVGATVAAKTLHPVYAPGTNIARYMYLSDRTNRDLPDWTRKSDVIASALRSSLARHPEDARFLGLIGDLSANSTLFAESWARNSDVPDELTVLIRHPGVGIMRLDQFRMPLGSDSEDTLVAWAGADRDSAAKLASLA
ncbi:hypothetical protein NVV95_06410 [Herbiconiux sp. CPCC 205716]|uniref:MmyB-like transcription regulator ligand binding domain-containing protein n=1 Tax=Herbiconiux gentiana TaxID=2970912 RepID=A0ABT2GDB3_9MICO|nr:hypothetical protein [Herbiconiux gentiana]MCS5714183.1 hypothetical protein [Herbiconiux gentiana]